MNTKELKQAIRSKYAWPGGYEIFGITSDGAILCTDCMRSEFRSIVWSIHNKVDDGWRVNAIDTSASLEHAEFIEAHPDEYSLDMCAHCNRVLNP